MSLLPPILLLLSCLAAAAGFCPVARLSLLLACYCRCMLCQVPIFFFLQNMEFSKDGAKEAGVDEGDPADLK